MQGGSVRLLVEELRFYLLWGAAKKKKKGGVYILEEYKK